MKKSSCCGLVRLRCVGVALACTALAGIAGAADVADLASQPLGSAETFQPMTPGRLDGAAARLREAIRGLDRLLARSASGADWKSYLEWDTLQAQAASPSGADPKVLGRLYRLLDAGENGLEMPAFANVRRALGGYLEAVDTAGNPEAGRIFQGRLDKLAKVVAAGAASRKPAEFDAVGPILARLEESGQAPGTVARIRSALSRPNLFLQVEESLLGAAVDRPIDETTTINDVVLGTRVRGIGHTVGSVRLDFVPSSGSAVMDLVLDATNHSETRGGQGPVTVRTLGTTTISARRRVLVDDLAVRAMPVDVDVSTDTHTAGIGVSSRCGERFIRKVATRRIAEMRPRAEAIAESKARDRVRQQFQEQTDGPIAEASSDYQTRFRGRLLSRGWYPEMLSLASDDRWLTATVRKSLPDQVAAFSPPPAVAGDAVLGARIHESFFNNLAEQELGGRTFTKEMVEQRLADAGQEVPESLKDDPDQPPWSITFRKRKPVELTVGDGTVRLTVHGSSYTSGENEFPAMDVWATYRIEKIDGKIRLVRDGDVQIYPPDFVPGGDKKLSLKQTSLRGILQKRFNRVFDEVIDVEPLALPGELERAGPLPICQLDARADGWVAAGWRSADRVAGEVAVPATLVHEAAAVTASGVSLSTP